MTRGQLVLLLVVNTVLAAVVGASTAGFFLQRGARIPANLEKPSTRIPVSTEPATQTPAPQPNACDADLKKFCKQEEILREGAGGCLSRHLDKLSRSCAESMKKAQVELMVKCRDDVDRLCPDIPRGAGRLIRCLRQNFDKLSKNCKHGIDPI